MSLPPLPSQTPPPAPENRPSRMARRTGRLRAVGVAGAVASLGVFTGLAASHQPAGGSDSAQQEVTMPTASDSANPQYDSGTDDSFFAEDEQPGIAPAGQDGPAAMSGGS